MSDQNYTVSIAHPSGIEINAKIKCSDIQAKKLCQIFSLGCWPDDTQITVRADEQK